MGNNLELWDRVRTPNPNYVKEFNRGGGFKGSATNTQYIVQRATEEFGLNGDGWGVEITDEKYVEGGFVDEKNRSIIHVIRGYVWYKNNGEVTKTSQQFGQTTFVGKNKFGIFTDEEAPKKSVTDMMLKCLSLLGFSADIFLGMWDDNKYVNDVKKKFEQEGAKKKGPDPQELESQFIAEADKNIGSVDELKQWYQSNKQKIASLPPAVAKKVNGYVSDLRDHLEEQADQNQKG